MSKNRPANSAKTRSEQAKSARERAREKQRKQRSPLNIYWIIGGAIAIAAIAITASIITNSGGVDPAFLTKYAETPAERNVLGASDATVTVQVWEDFL